MPNRLNRILRDATGAPIVAQRGAQMAERNALTGLDSLDITEVRAVLAGQMEGMDLEEMAALIIRLRLKKRRERIIGMLSEAYGDIVRILEDEMGYDTDRDKANFKDTPRRAAEAFFDSHPPRWLLEQELLLQLSTRFPGYREDRMASPSQAKYGAMVVVSDIIAYGMCPHHLMPIRYAIHLAYLPQSDTDGDAEVLGLSKLPRTAQAIACQPILHEDVPELIADVLYKPPVGAPSAEIGEDDDDHTEEVAAWDALRVRSDGAAVIADAKHSCICARGVRQELSRTSSMALRGSFANNDLGCRDEFLAHIDRLVR